ncbi:MAG: transcription-repair coupling factor [Bacilli bacterium]|nr:transcription-repair coupling factor [Bacilli bacterium]
MKAILDLIGKKKVVDAFLQGKGKTIICSENEEEALVIASAFAHGDKTIVVVKNSLYAAQRLYDRLINLLNNDDSCLFFPSDESFRIEAIASSKELLAQRVYVLNKLIEKEKTIVITHTAAIVRYIPPKQEFIDNIKNIKLNSEMDINQLCNFLSNCGYEKVNMIEHSLQYAQRGGVLDIFSLNYDNPIRIEFFGNNVDSLRFFDLDTQKTIEITKEVKIIPATDLIASESTLFNKINGLINNPDILEIQKEDLKELLDTRNYSLLYKYYKLLQNNPESLINYFSKDAILIVSNYDYIKENYNILLKETFEYLEEENNINLKLHHELSEILNLLNSKTYLNEFKKKDSDIYSGITSVESSNGNSIVARQIIENYLKNNKVVLCLENKNQIDYIKSWVKEWGLDLKYIDYNVLPKNKLNYTEFVLKEGFYIKEDSLVYISARELFGNGGVSYRSISRYKQGIPLQSYENLKIGDYVIHETHGIGKFLGIETIEMDGIHRDYLHIGYKGNDVLYVPLEQFRLIRKFVSKEGIEPKLNKLGGEEWQKTKSRIKGRIADIADRLMNLYSERVNNTGFAFGKDDEWQKEFENSFPFELTPDQKRSVVEIKKDMESPYPMDRLLCGDVGFGKTEVAFIASFKAIMSGKQVALLCPTTLLSYQHYENAKQRFQNFPINVGILNRFISLREQNKYLRELENGSMHFVVGTHRLLSNDIKFKDLGLLIVDEEQRFGVEHKEKIKELKKSVDVLTLSATPIPRTLQMALIGVRSLSQIDTPPLQRMPIQTYVIEKNSKLIKEIIERELAREGQVFYLYNKISNIYSVAKDIESRIRGAKVIVIHGRMSKEDTEEAMYRFNNKEANVMVCTTIIENGIDIPNANTIIIEDADHFGLSQLYQIKGRVGRGDRLAYAYLLYRPQKQLSEIATKRLRAIKEFAELGSGYRIAMRDLSIRGAGDILGAEQSGFIDMVGIDMYIRLLHEAIEERKTGIKTPEPEINNPIAIDAYINKEFTNDDMDKINLYQKIDEAKNLKELKDLEDEMTDIYGKLPTNVKLLLEKRRLEILKSNDIVESSQDSKEYYEITFSSKVMDINGVGIFLFKITQEISRNINLTFRNKKIKMKLYKKDKMWLNNLIIILEKIKSYVKNQDN